MALPAAGLTSVRVAITGGGIAGPALALLLKQRLGWRAEVFERDIDIREVGAGISLAPNGVRVLSQLGIKEQVVGAGEKISAMCMSRSDGSRIVQFPTKAEEQYGLSMVGFRRHRLRKVLLDKMAAEGIPLHLNKHLKSITQPMAATSSNAADATVATGPAVLQFEDGSSYEADLGCDGLRSATRQALFGPQAPRYTGDEVLFAVSAERNLDVLPANLVHMVYGSGGRHFGMYGAGKDMAWFTVTPTPESKDSWGLVPKERLAEEQARVLAAYKGWGVVEELASRPVAVMVKVGIYDRDPTDTWSKGTVTLAGDAANPIPANLGQGGNKALEDAGCLAAALAHTFCSSSHNGSHGASLNGPNGSSNSSSNNGGVIGSSMRSDHQQHAAAPADLHVQLAAALKLYEAARLPRAAQLLDKSRQAGVMSQLQGTFACWLRDNALRAGVWACGGSLPSGWLWAYDCEKAVAKAAAARR